MSALTPLPDSERIVIAFLAAHAELEALLLDADHETNRVYPDAREHGAFPFLTVQRIGGRPEAVPHWIDHALIQLLGWAAAGERAQAREVCALALAALHELPGRTDLGVITEVVAVQGPRSLPDPETSNPRFLAEALVTTHPVVLSGS